MTIRKVLVPFLGLPADAPVLSSAFSLGTLLNAHLEICYVEPDPEDLTPPRIDSGLGGDEYQKEYLRRAVATARRAATRSRRQFNLACRKHGVTRSTSPVTQSGLTAGWSKASGPANDVIPAAAKFCDLTLFAESTVVRHRLLPTVLEHTLLVSGRPVLFVPNEISMTFPGHATIAWDASVPIVRAVGAAWSILRKAETISVLFVDGPNEGNADPQSLVDFFAWHGLDACGRVVPRMGRDVGEVIVDSMKGSNSDLLIMGGFAHNRFEELILGGTTRSALRHADMPVFLMH